MRRRFDQGNWVVLFCGLTASAWLAACNPSSDALAGAPVSAADAAVDSPATGAPDRLSGTGYFSLGAARRAYAPTFPLFSDGATKPRSVFLPSPIDNTDPDHWSMPVGAKFWKEFAIAGTPIETRYIERTGPGPDDFLYATYFWKTENGATPTDPVLLGPDEAIDDANGTDHDIPTQAQCHRCHDQTRERVLGFSAIQLGEGASGLTESALGAAHLLTSAPAGAPYVAPGDAVTRAALGYLHANCGTCHNDSPGIAMPDPVMNLRLRLSDKTPSDTGVFQTAVNIALTTYLAHVDDGVAFRIEGGNATKSAISFRMAQRGAGGPPDPNQIPRHDPNQMPPLATEQVDTAGVAAINAFIATVPAPRDQ
jgi:hypothetical protein